MESQCTGLEVHHLHLEGFTLKLVRDDLRDRRCAVIIVVAVDVLVLLGEILETVVVVVQLKIVVGLTAISMVTRLVAVRFAEERLRLGLGVIDRKVGQLLYITHTYTYSAYS